jgi:hypothetical protein
MYICVAMEGHGKSPWRKWDGHTPDPDGERIMIDLATDSSIRYADVVSIDVRNSHIKQFHADHGFAPPPMPALTHMIGKLRTLVRFECDSGRAEQGAWTPVMMDKHFQQIDDWKQEELAHGNLLEVEQLGEFEMALSAAFEVAGRLGNFCKGEGWVCDDQNAWTRATLHWLLLADPRLWDAKGVLLPPVWSKTSNSKSDAAREAARQSFLYLVHTGHLYGLIALCKRNAVY